MKQTWNLRLDSVIRFATGVIAMTMFSGCVSSRINLPPVNYPDLIPTEQAIPGSMTLRADTVQAMYVELLPVDLATVVRTALAENLEIKLARERVQASLGQYDSALGSLFPVFSPTLLFENVDGAVRATPGNLVDVGFQTTQQFLFIQWLQNPGKVISDCIVSRKRAVASKYRERAIQAETLRKAVNQYYDLIYYQLKVSLSQQALSESTELHRVIESRANVGDAREADVLRAKAEIAARQQDLILSIKSFYDASVALATTLHLDPRTTLVPHTETVSPVSLLESSLTIDDLIALAVEYRDDLKSVRVLAETAVVESNAVLFTGIGPNVQASHQNGSIRGEADDVNNGLDESFSSEHQARNTVSATLKLGLSLIGDLNSAKANRRRADIEAEKLLDDVKAQVVRAMQNSRSQREIIHWAAEQVQSASEAHRLAEAGLKSGTATTLDVLHVQTALEQARLRHAESIVRYNQAQTDLVSALGVIRPEVFGIGIE